MLQDVAAKLDVFLPNAQLDALDNLKSLKDKVTAKEITEAAIQMFCDDFEQVEHAIEDHDEEVDRADSTVAHEQTQVSSVDRDAQEGDENEEGDKQQRTMFGPYFPRTTAEIRVLLS